MYRLVTSQFEEFEDALRGVQGHFVLRSRKQTDWKLRVVDLNGVSLSFGQAGAAHIYNGAGLAGQFTFFVLLSRHEDFTLDGVQFDRRKIGWLVPEISFHAHARRPPTALSVTISGERVTSWLSSHPTKADAALLERNSVKLAGHSAAEFVRMAHRVFAWDRNSSMAGCNPATEKAARHALLGAVFEALLPRKDQKQIGRPVKHGSRVLDCALAVIESGTDEPINSDDLCRAAGVSERTLRNVFYRNFGISPHRYLMVEKLHRARSALHEARPGDTVSSICANLGLWDAGRFAARYRHLFGVLPSQDLAMHRTSPLDRHRTAQFQALH